MFDWLVWRLVLFLPGQARETCQRAGGVFPCINGHALKMLKSTKTNSWKKWSGLFSYNNSVAVLEFHSIFQGASEATRGNCQVAEAHFGGRKSIWRMTQAHTFFLHCMLKIAVRLTEETLHKIKYSQKHSSNCSCWRPLDWQALANFQATGTTSKRHKPLWGTWPQSPY